MGQTSHAVPVADPDPVLYSTGFDESIAHMSDEFTHKADMDGKVTDIEGNYIAVEYEDGTTDVFPLKRIERNSAKGRHSSNEFNLMPNIKVGSKFNEGDVIAYNKQFFKTDGHSLHFMPGPIVKCALHYAPETYEDATLVNETLTKRMATKTVKKYTVKLEADGKIDDAITSFEKVKAGDVLMKFETMLGDDELNEFLNIESSDLNKIEKKVKRGGKLIDMKVYRTSNLEEYSNSIQYHIKKIDDYMMKDPSSRADLLEEKGSTKQKILNNKKNSKVDPGSKIGGVNIEKDEVLFEFYVESVDTFSKGDKTTAHTALKFIDAKVLPDDKMPIGVDTGDKVDIVISTFSVIKRMTNSVLYSGLMQKALRKLNEDVRDILDL